MNCESKVISFLTIKHVACMVGAIWDAWSYCPELDHTQHSLPKYILYLPQSNESILIQMIVYDSEIHNDCHSSTLFAENELLSWQ